MPIEIPAATSPPADEPRRAGLLAMDISLRRRGIRSRDRMFFTERLALLLDTGNPLHVSLEALEHQIGSPELKKVIGEVRDGVAGGLAFSQALARHPEAFPGSYVNLVAAGETGGFLPRVLQRLQEMDQRREELRSVLFSAFSYPAFLIVFSVAVVFFILAFVFPKFGDLFEMIWDQLPVTTRLLMALSTGLQHYWAPLLLALAGAGWLAWRWWRGPSAAAALDRLGLRLPLVRELLVELHLVQLLNVMSLSLANGVPMLDALRSSREVLRSEAFRRFVDSLEKRVSEGRNIASGFQEARFLPQLAQQMITTGEESGSLVMVMGRMADFYERELKRKLETLAKIVEPAMLLVMGVIVGLLVSSLILPIFKLSTAVR